MRTVLLTYTIEVDLDDDQPQGEEIPAGAPVEFYKLESDDLRQAIGEAGEEYFASVKNVTPDSVEFLD